MRVRPVSYTHLDVYKRQIMYDLALGIDLIEATREKQGTIQARIESTQVIDVRILYLDLT